MSMKRHQMAVFRLSVYLRGSGSRAFTDSVVITIKRFPSFAMTVKTVFFWHYMDAAKRHYTVQPETEFHAAL
jgi:hypothetical protein